MEIRVAKREEINEIIEIEKNCFPDSEAASSQELKDRYQTFSENFFVAFKDDKIIGYIAGACTNQPLLPDELYHDVSLHVPNGDYQTVFSLAVLPAYQHEGVGRKLLEYIIEVSKKRGKAGVVLTCKDHLIDFYQGSGFQCLGRSLSHHGGAIWNDMLLMIKEKDHVKEY